MTRPSPGTAALLALMQTDLPAFIAAVRKALERAGNYPDAGTALGVPSRTLHRWVDEYPAIMKGLELRSAGRPVEKKLRAKKSGRAG